jgi:hypothetical protein
VTALAETLVWQPPTSRVDGKRATMLTSESIQNAERTQLLKTLNWHRNESDMGVIADSILELGFRITKP